MFNSARNVWTPPRTAIVCSICEWLLAARNHEVRNAICLQVGFAHELRVDGREIDLDPDLFGGGVRHVRTRQSLPRARIIGRDFLIRYYA
jgi:hypothetical protein